MDLLFESLSALAVFGQLHPIKEWFDEASTKITIEMVTFLIVIQLNDRQFSPRRLSAACNFSLP